VTLEVVTIKVKHFLLYDKENKLILK